MNLANFFLWVISYVQILQRQTSQGWNKLYVITEIGVCLSQLTAVTCETIWLY